MRRTIGGIVVLCLLALLPAGISGWWHWDTMHESVQAAVNPQVYDKWAVTVGQVSAWEGDILWVDARSVHQKETEIASKVPVNALHLNEDTWGEQITLVLDAWRPEIKLVVFCNAKTCNASREVARRLREEIGLPEVYYLLGGVEALVLMPAQKNIEAVR